MRMLAVIMMGGALTATAVRAEKLSVPDREALLDNLEKMNDAAMAKVDARFRIAMARYTTAMQDDKAALEFYLECIDLMNFKGQGKKTSEFIEWKSKERDKLNDPGFKAALRYQLSWLVLTLRACSVKADRPALALEAQGIVDSIFHNADKLTGQEQMLNQSCTSTIFAKVYEISHLENDKWPTSPIHLDNVYEKLVFPPLRTPGKVESLRAAWIKRIQQEGIKVEAWGSKERRNRAADTKGKGNKKGETKAESKAAAAEAKSDAFEKFLQEALPQLQWQMEVDLFNNGDEKGAAMRMFAQIEKFADDKNAKNWSEELKALLQPKPPAPPAAPALTVTPVE